MNSDARVLLEVDDIPKEYVNMLPFLKEPLPSPLEPGADRPVAPEALIALFPRECVAQEVSTERRIRCQRMCVRHMRSMVVPHRSNGHVG